MDLFRHTFATAPLQLVASAPIVVFGATINIQSIVRFLHVLGGNVVAITDNNSAKWGKTVEGIPIVQPAQKIFKDKITIVATTPTSFPVIGEQLNGWGYSEGKNFFSLFKLFEKELHQQNGLDSINSSSTQDQCFLFSEIFHSHLTDSAARNVHIFYTWNQYLQKNGHSFEDKEVLELGFGGSLIPAMMMILAGADHVTALDYIETPATFRSQQYREMLSYIAEYGLSGQGFNSRTDEGASEVCGKVI